MKYEVLRTQTKTDGTVQNNVTIYDTLDEAVIKYHSNIAADMQKEDMQSTLCMVINSVGGTYSNLNTYWERKDTEAVPEATASDDAE